MARNHRLWWTNKLENQCHKEIDFFNCDSKVSLIDHAICLVEGKPKAIASKKKELYQIGCTMILQDLQEKIEKYPRLVLNLDIDCGKVIKNHFVISKNAVL